MRKMGALFLSAAMALLLAACGSSGNQGGSPAAQTSETTAAVTSAGEKSTASGTLTVAVWDKNQEPGLTKILEDFTAETGIKAKIQVTPWDQYWTMLEAGATGGSMPDVFWMHSNEFSRYAEYEMLLDLNDRIAGSDKIEMDKFPADIVDLYTWNDKHYAIPKDIDTIALWYNKTMFDEAGLGYPDESWTWDDFADACKTLTKEDSSQYGYALKLSQNSDGWYNMVYDFGGEIISEDQKSSGFDKDGTIAAIEFMTDLVKQGYTPSYETMTENNPEALFEAGTVGMVTMGSWMLSELCNNDYVKANGDIAVLPKGTETGRRATIYNGLGWAAAANTQMPAEAWAMIEYMGSYEAQQKQSDLGVVISAYEGSTANWVATYPDFNLQAYLDMMSDMVIRPHSKTTLTWENMMTEKLVDALTGARPVKDVCADIAAEMNSLLASE